MNDSERKARSEYERKARYQPPPLVKKRRMKRSCSEWELLVLILSMATSEDEGETLEHLPNCMDHGGESSMKIARRIRARPAERGSSISGAAGSESACPARSRQRVVRSSLAINGEGQGKPLGVVWSAGLRLHPNE